MKMNLLEAMAHLEGWGKLGTRAMRNCNPGNIEWGEFARSHGAEGIEVIPEGYVSTPRYARFPTAEAGFKAMRALMMGPHYRDLTVRQAITRWSPPSENDTEGYIRYVCKQVGCGEDALVSELMKEEEGGG